jgi:hypothetical protein
MSCYSKTSQELDTRTRGKILQVCSESSLRQASVDWARGGAGEKATIEERPGSFCVVPFNVRFTDSIIGIFIR